MRSLLSRLILSMVIGLGLSVLPAQAQSDRQVGALVEALRQAAPDTGTEDDGLYSDWQILPDNIPRWSRSCLGREISPTDFAASPVTARNVVTCVMRDVLQEQYGDSNNNETLAVRRAAAWWMTGDPSRYDSGDTAAYTRRVLSLYQQQVGSTAAPTPATQTTSVFDRYMQAGYAATQQGDYPTALLYFRRALDERPDDTYAQQAIQNVEGYLNRQGTPPPAPVDPPAAANPEPQSQATPAEPAATIAESTADSVTETVAALSEAEAIALITQWLTAKQQIFAPPFNQQLAQQLTTGELYGSLVDPNGVISWLHHHQAYYRFGVQSIGSVAQFFAEGDRATIEVEVSEERTLYENGSVNPDYTSLGTDLIRYSLQSVDGNWRIADYKRVDGSLLERSILPTPS